MNAEPRRHAVYTSVAVALHWAIAAAILALLLAGWWMTDAFASGDPQAQALAKDVIQIHKAAGLTVLLLSVARLVWRLLNPPPPLPIAMPAWQRAASHASHLLLYGFMIGAPLTGWAMVSSSPQFSGFPTSYFGLFLAPHLPVVDWAAALTGLGPEEAKAAVAPLAQSAHHWLAVLGAALLALHVGAALKHHFIDRDAVLARMTPGVAPLGEVSAEPAAPRASSAAQALAAALSIAALAAVVLLFLSTTDQTEPVRTDAVVDLVPVDQPPANAETRWSAPAWAVIPAESAIRFEGTQLGAPLGGVFERWRAEIRFAPDALEASGVRVEIDAASAVTGDLQADGTLPGEDFFDVADHPTAVFETERIERVGAGYRAVGALSLGGETQKVAFPFELSIDGDRAEMTAALTLDRLAFGLGRALDPDAGFIAREVSVALRVVAQRAP